MTTKLWRVAILAIVFGVAVELSVSLSTNHIEAWDWSGYGYALFPLQAVVWGLCAWFVPRRVWLWPLLGAVGRLLGIGIGSGDPLAILLLFPLGFMFMIPELIAFEAVSLIVAFLSRRRRRKAA